MYQTINRYDFHNAFKAMGRETQFSFEAKDLLYDFLEEDEKNTDDGIELDVVSLCCEYSEEHYKDIFNGYDIICESDEPTDEEVKQTVIEYLIDNTFYIGPTKDGNLLFQQF